ncbi:MAG: PAS domain-containing sensor histidine kinase [Gammaproteobacteria bacterium]|nr:PAS domain-containing sensor histidine kinase [Gammaproteobacteria bacterium]
MSHELTDTLILQNIAKYMLGHVYWKDAHGVYLGCNDKQAQSLGFEKGAEVVGKTDFELPWPPESARQFRENDLRIMESGLAQLLEETAYIGRKKATVLSLKAPIKDAENEVCGVLGISIDITEEKKAQLREKKAIAMMAKERALKREEKNSKMSIATLTSSIAHDMRNPLSSLMITLDSVSAANQRHLNGISKIQNTQPDLMVQCHEHINTIEKMVTKMKNEIWECNNSIAATLRGIDNYLKDKVDTQDFKACEIGSMLTELLEKYAFPEGGKEKLYILDIEHFYFEAIPLLFYRVLMNLLNNAYEQIEIKKTGNIAIRSSSSNGFGYLYIKDTAGGVTQSIIASLFNGYQTTKEGGTGVGLNFCKLTMQAFGGDITAHLVDEEFIEFVLSIPLVKQNTN